MYRILHILFVIMHIIRIIMHIYHLFTFSRVELRIPPRLFGREKSPKGFESLLEMYGSRSCRTNGVYISLSQFGIYTLISMGLLQGMQGGPHGNPVLEEIDSPQCAYIRWIWIALKREEVPTTDSWRV